MRNDENRLRIHSQRGDLLVQAQLGRHVKRSNFKTRKKEPAAEMLLPLLWFLCTYEKNVPAADILSPLL